MRTWWMESSVRGLRYSRVGVLGVASITRGAHTFRPGCNPERLHVARTGTSASVSPLHLSGLASKGIGCNGRISLATLSAVRRASGDLNRLRSTQQVQLALLDGPVSASALRPPLSSSVLRGLRPRALGAASNVVACSRFSASTNGTTAEKGAGGVPFAEADVAEVAKPTKEEPRHAHIQLPSITDERVATLTSWNVQLGDVIKVDDVVCEIELEQFSVGVKVDTPGFFAEILVEAGTKNVPVGADIGTIVHSQEDIALYQQAQALTGKDKEASAEPGETFSWKDVLKDVLRLRKEDKLSEGDASTLMSLARNKDSELLQAFEGCFEGDEYKGEIDEDLFLAQAIDIAKMTREGREKDL